MRHLAVSDADRRARARSEELWRASRQGGTDSRILLLVDLSYQVYRASAKHPMLTSGRTFTGGLYGFFVTIAKMIRETRATDIVFCQDVRPYKRSETYPEYKQFRKKAADEELLMMYKQSMRLVLETLEAASLPVWGIPGFECDDLIAHVVGKYRNRFRAIYAGTNDSDIYQLLWCEKFFIYRKSIADLMTAKLYREQFGGMTSEQYILWLALQGTHNDVAGIDGVGPKTAIAIVREPATLRKYKEKHGKLIERNVGLIRLPHPDFPFEASIPVPGSPYNHRALIRELSSYDIDFTGSIDKSFRQATGNY